MGGLKYGEVAKKCTFLKILLTGARLNNLLSGNIMGLKILNGNVNVEVFF